MNFYCFGNINCHFNVAFVLLLTILALKCKDQRFAIRRRLFNSNGFKDAIALIGNLTFHLAKRDPESNYRHVVGRLAKFDEGCSRNVTSL